MTRRAVVRRDAARRVARFAILLALPLLLGACSGSGGGAPTVGVSINDGSAASGGGTMALSLQLLIALTILAIVPSILLMATSFTRIVVVLSLLRSAIGIPQLPPNQILLGLSLFLTLFIMGPVFTKVNDQAVQPYLAGSITTDEAIQQGIAPMRTFMLAQTSESDIQLFLDLSKKPRPATVDRDPGRGHPAGLRDQRAQDRLHDGLPAVHPVPGHRPGRGVRP